MPIDLGYNVIDRKLLAKKNKHGFLFNSKVAGLRAGLFLCEINKNKLDKTYKNTYTNTVRRTLLMKSYNSKELLKILKKNGWIETGIQRGSHKYLVNPEHPELGKVTVPCPRNSYPIRTLKSIEKQTGVKL